MKRSCLCLMLAVILLLSSQATAFADLVVKSPDDPAFDGGVVTVDASDTWRSNPEFMSGLDWQPAELSLEESEAAAAKERESAERLAADIVTRSYLYSGLSSIENPDAGSGAAIASNISIPQYYFSTYFKIPNYNQGPTPYCGPLSALQILRYKRYNELNLIRNLIREMYIPGSGTNIWRLARSLRSRLRFNYVVSPVTSVSNYIFKHFLTVAGSRMPIDNLVRIYPKRLGRYRAYHSGHFIDSSGIKLGVYSKLIYVTDTYQEYVSGGPSGTLGPQWVPLSQMYWAVRYHPLHSVVY